MTDEETQEYEIKSVGTGLLGDVQETLVIKGEKKSDTKQYKAGDTITLTDSQKKDLEGLGVKFTDVDADSQDGEESDDVSTPTFP